MSLFERLGLLVLGLVLFLPGIGGRDLWNPDEPRYAEVTGVTVSERAPCGMMTFDVVRGGWG